MQLSAVHMLVQICLRNILENVLRNKYVLSRMQERVQREPETLLVVLNFARDEFRFMREIIHDILPVCTASKEISSGSSYIGDIITAITSTLDVIIRESVPSNAPEFKDVLIDPVYSLLNILLDTEKQLSVSCGRKFTNVTPNDHTITVHLKPLYCTPMHV